MTKKEAEQALIPGSERLTEELARNPYAIVAGAVGVGFVLGGGLFTRLTARLVNAGLRAAVAAALPPLMDELLAVANREGKTSGAGRHESPRQAKDHKPR